MTPPENFDTGTATCASDNYELCFQLCLPSTDHTDLTQCTYHSSRLSSLKCLHTSRIKCTRRICWKIAPSERSPITKVGVATFSFSQGVINSATELEAISRKKKNARKSIRRCASITGKTCKIYCYDR